jgi:hypothetical protein
MSSVWRRLGQGAGLAAASLGVACHPVERGHIHFVGPQSGFMQVAAKLDCPVHSHDLTRASVAADGASCTYDGPNEETVSLRLQPLAGATPEAVLAKWEGQLKSDAGPGSFTPSSEPTTADRLDPHAKDGDAGDARHNEVDDKDNSDKDAADHGRTKIDLPGVHISTDGDKADVSLPGLSIHANGDNAQVKAGLWGHSASIAGNNGGAMIRIGRADKSGVDAMMMLVSDAPGPTGYRTVGYVAKGPPTGPLVIATFKSKSYDHHDHNDAGDGVKKLVNLNVHQGFGWVSDSADGAGKGAQP